MSRIALAPLFALLALAALVAACSGGGEQREIAVTVEDQACTPATIAAKPGERLALAVTNRSGADRELEGIDGTKLAEVLVPAGHARTLHYTVPDGEGTHRIKCYQPGGPTTIIEITASASGDAGAAQFRTTEPPAQTVAVTLDSFTVAPNQASVPAGAIRFDTRNTHAHDTHELAVLLLKPDGARQVAGEVEGLAAGQSGSIVLKLPAGRYELACLIAKGEAGSTVDHYAAGMHTAFEVR